ncbi:MAG: hypothetical protein R2789_19040 [Microthrixaceae bacterium]
MGLPVAHIMGFVALLAPMISGVPVYFLDRFSASRVLDVIEERRVARSSVCRPCTGCCSRPGRRTATSPRCGSGCPVPM